MGQIGQLAQDRRGRLILAGNYHLPVPIGNRVAASTTTCTLGWTHDRLLKSIVFPAAFQQHEVDIDVSRPFGLAGLAGLRHCPDLPARCQREGMLLCRFSQGEHQNRILLCRKGPCPTYTDILLTPSALQVQSGGSFDLDYEVTGPEDKIVLTGEKERQGDFVFTAQRAGDYKFCFNNDMSTYTEKVVDFEIAVR